ncbi:hypothetical protein L249_1835 [Ophiocordyceps polyrhachis-furcata BCC 54312]|uniref:Peptide hydrolase n=1 Tax=Ophiocordyceps polyrhachis-furcata BCC 54312 TaxID=1330021 RepID=A0A367LNR6_9HYPO|nr:hypothetical protein L249_1835 [Ophiocordyceps polyrhachis-furcata BCC 54312]
MKLGNPFAFGPGPVTFWTTAVYLAVVIPLIYVHETVPPAPGNDAIARGLNLTEAWGDLQFMTKAYHPYSSRQNDVVRRHLLDRAAQILVRNGIGYAVEPGSFASGGSAERAPGAVIFDDRVSNVTYTYQASGSSPWAGEYFEGSNVYVYVRGKEDPDGDWWVSQSIMSSSRHTGSGVLVNCHFDSVSTGYGATDDGVACVAMLQLLSYFTSQGRQPKYGIVFLFNNAEEDGLLGARAFGNSPLLSFCHTFVNLEGAGAGGRAMLFRTTDLETAKAYSGSPHPFGSVVAANAFESDIIRSDTDYSVFAKVYGQRGLDIAFYEPRSRYHTQEDDARHTSTDSVWHMLSAALASTEALSAITGADFRGPRSDGRKDLAQNGRPTEGVWFDLFGSAWAAFPLRGLFAWSLTLLVATPLVLMLITYFLARSDRYYLFAKEVDDPDEGEPVALRGWRGFFRYPFALVVAVALTIGSVLLVAKVNPLIIYSSSYAVWAMTMSLFYLSFWLLARGASFVRPSALQRGFAILWLYVICWAFQVLAAVAEDRLHIGALYFAAFLHTAVFVSLAVSLLEQFALPAKHDFAARRLRLDAGSGSSSSGSTEDQGAEDEADDEPTETTPLRAGEPSYGSNGDDNAETTFASTYRRSVAAVEEESAKPQGQPADAAHDGEQAWSDQLPTWTWFVQLLLLAPVHVMILGNLGLVQTASMSMTGPDGNSLLIPLMAVGITGILLLLPLTPFLHRVTHHVPLFLLAVFVGTLIYNLVAFPFSASSRFKFRFQQTIDLDEGTNTVSITGLETFVRPVVASLPSAAGQDVACPASPIRGLVDCIYDASLLPPKPVNGTKLEDLVVVEAHASDDGRTARVGIRAKATRLCYLETSKPIFGFAVEGGAGRDDRFGSFPDHEGFRTIRLWRRSWEASWNVTLHLVDDDHRQNRDRNRYYANKDETQADDDDNNNKPLEVAVRCVWNDANSAGSTMAAFDEVLRFMPDWSAVTKTTVGLEGGGDGQGGDATGGADGGGTGGDDGGGGAGADGGGHDLGGGLGGDLDGHALDLAGGVLVLGVGDADLQALGEDLV